MGVSYANFVQREGTPVLRTLSSELEKVSSFIFESDRQKSLDELRDLANRRKYEDNSEKFIGLFNEHVGNFGFQYYLEGGIPKSELDELRSLYVDNQVEYTKKTYEENRRESKEIRKQMIDDREKMGRNPFHKPSPGSKGYFDDVFLNN